MSLPTWAETICQSPTTSRITNINTFIQNSSSVQQSPIDIFYTAVKEILLLLSSSPTFLSTYPTIGPLLLVGLVSATENYFRDAYSSIISICPIAQNSCLDKSINLASVIWHGEHGRERGAFETFSFASSKNIKKTSKEYVGHEILSDNSKNSLLEEFDKLCELRHGIVHASGLMPGKNAIALRLIKTQGLKSICVNNSQQIQECGSICMSLVQSANQELFHVLIKRWAKDWRDLSTWIPAEEYNLFKSIWNTFYSHIDANSGTISSPLTCKKCSNQAKKTFGI